jgi:hypothetical protein
VAVAEEVIVFAVLAVRTLYAADQQQRNADRYQSGKQVFHRGKSMKKAKHTHQPP